MTASACQQSSSTHRFAASPTSAPPHTPSLIFTPSFTPAAFLTSILSHYFEVFPLTPAGRPSIGQTPVTAAEPSGMKYHYTLASVQLKTEARLRKACWPLRAGTPNRCSMTITPHYEGSLPRPPLSTLPPVHPAGTHVSAPLCWPSIGPSPVPLQDPPTWLQFS